MIFASNFHIFMHRCIQIDWIFTLWMETSKIRTNIKKLEKKKESLMQSKLASPSKSLCVVGCFEPCVSNISIAMLFWCYSIDPDDTSFLSCYYSVISFSFNSSSFHLPYLAKFEKSPLITPWAWWWIFSISPICRLECVNILYILRFVKNSYVRSESFLESLPSQGQSLQDFLEF